MKAGTIVRSKATWTRACALLVPVSLIVASAYGGESCHPLVVGDSASLVSANPGEASYLLELPPVAGAAEDFFHLEFYGAAVGQAGSWPLGSGDDSNYATCSHCVLIRRDCKGPGCDKIFFADQGVMFLGADVGVPALPVTANAWRLVEVTIDPGTFVSTPVPGGECYVQVGDPVFANGFEAL